MESSSSSSSSTRRRAPRASQGPRQPRQPRAPRPQGSRGPRGSRARNNNNPLPLPQVRIVNDTLVIEHNQMVHILPLNVLPLPLNAMPLPRPNHQLGDAFRVDQDTLKCVVCQENMTDCEVTACNAKHHLMCEECAKGIERSSPNVKKCPICRTEGAFHRVTNWQDKVAASGLLTACELGCGKQLHRDDQEAHYEKCAAIY